MYYSRHNNFILPYDTSLNVSEKMTVTWPNVDFEMTCTEDDIKLVTLKVMITHCNLVKLYLSSSIRA